jgi:GntR family transcriptional regulator
LEQGYHVETKVLRVEIVPAPRTVAHELRLRSDEPVTVIDRLRFILNEPILLVTAYVPQKICPSLINEDLAHNSLYHLLQGKYNLRIAHAKRFMEAVAANELEARLLSIEPGLPLMLIESTAYLEDGIPLEYFKARHRGDRTRFLVESFTRILTNERQ